MKVGGNSIPFQTISQLQVNPDRLKQRKHLYQFTFYDEKFNLYQYVVQKDGVHRKLSDLANSHANTTAYRNFIQPTYPTAV